MILVKGLTIKSRLDFAQQAGGEQLIQKLRRMPSPVGDAAMATMIAFRSFPFSTDDAICRAIAEFIGRGNETYARLGAFYADNNRGMENVVLGAKTDPAKLIARIPAMLDYLLQGKSGTARCEFPEQIQGRIIWEGHQECYESHCLTSLGYFTRVLENSGVEKVRGNNLECVANGARRCVWDFSWEKVTGLRRSTKSRKTVQAGG